MKLKLLALACSLIWLEAVARGIFAVNWHGFGTTRRLMLGEAIPIENFQRMSGQAYLLYIPTPNLSDEFGLQHNAHGYRGELVPMKRTENTLRILCMGGSTTYGAGVRFPGETYPAQLQRLLSQNLPANIRAVEVINAGIPSGTTAELLTHYHFKFHYYRPDLAIIQAGGNDALALVTPYYTPDYSHTRKAPQVPRPLPPAGRVLLTSRLLSLIIVPILHGPYPGAGYFYSYEGLPPAAQWFPDGDGRQGQPDPASLPVDQIAFHHNLQQVLRMMQVDGVKVLLVPFQSNPRDPFEPVDAVEAEKSLLMQLSSKMEVPVAPFPASVISPTNWIDDCHLNAAGEIEKATYLAPYVKRLLWPTADHAPE